MQCFKILLPTLLLLSTIGTAQRIDQTASFRSPAGEKYVRLHYDNDFFAESDYYYTQGYSFEVVNPVLKKNPLNKLLIKLPNGFERNGVAFEHYGFTPTSISSNAILYNDRPFAGVIMLKTFRTSTDTINKTRLSAILSTGMIGPASFAGGMQTKIHQWTGDREPKGWQYQIRNDVVINYEVQFEKELLNLHNLISLNTDSQLQLGTLNNKVKAGLTLKLGKFSSLLQNSQPVKKNFQFYLYNQSLAGFNAYDATLQGGIFNRKSPYKLSASQLQRVTFQNNLGAVVQCWRLYFEYYQTFLTREFKTGLDHRWGGVKIGFIL